MANVNLKMLEVAIEHRLITKNLSKVEEVTLKKSIITGNKIYLIIKKSGENGVNCEQIEQKMKMNVQTIQIFLRRFELSELIVSGIEETNLVGSPRKIYYAR